MFSPFLLCSETSVINFFLIRDSRGTTTLQSVISGCENSFVCCIQVMHARCGYVGASNPRTVFIDLNDVNRKLKPLTRNPVQFVSKKGGRKISKIFKENK